MLETAGFQSLRAETGKQRDRLKLLPALELGYYLDKRGANYWMADPEYCGCLFHGDEQAYQRYLELEKDNQLAQRDRQAMLTRSYQRPAFGGPFGAFGPGPPGLGFGFGSGGIGFGGSFQIP